MKWRLCKWCVYWEKHSSLVMNKNTHTGNRSICTRWYVRHCRALSACDVVNQVASWSISNLVSLARTFNEWYKIKPGAFHPFRFVKIQQVGKSRAQSAIPCHPYKINKWLSIPKCVFKEQLPWRTVFFLKIGEMKFTAKSSLNVVT